MVKQAKSLASNESLVEETGGTERRKRVDLEHSTDHMAGGLRVATQVHSRTRTEEGSDFFWFTVTRHSVFNFPPNHSCATAPRQQVKIRYVIIIKQLNKLTAVNNTNIIKIYIFDCSRKRRSAKHGRRLGKLVS